MNNSGVSINLDLAKPATVLVEKIADAVGVLYEPKRIKHNAEAKAEAKIILAKANVKVSAIEQRALSRMIAEESKKQANMESIVEKSLLSLDEDAHPEQIEDDWLSNFFEKSRITSDEEMQDVWARILSSEANTPGTFSKRTVNLVAELEKEDAVALTKLASFVLVINGKTYPLIFEPEDEIYGQNGINFDLISHLTSLGFITFEALAGYRTYRRGEKGGVFIADYNGSSHTLKVADDADSSVAVGKVLLTNTGKELVKICSSENIQGFGDYVLQKFREANILVDGR